MDFAEYTRIPAVNWSALRHMRVSPKHFAHALKAERHDTTALKLGRAVHTAVFESDRLLRDYVLWEGGRRAGKEWDAFQDLHTGKTILKVDEYERACAIRDAVHAHPLVPPLLAGGQAEHVLTWTDQRSGVDCKARLDMLTGATVVDLKTSRHATDPRLFASAAWSLGYFHQLAFYQRGARTVTGIDAPAIIIAVESAAPFDVRVYPLDEDDLWLASEQIDEMLAKLVECRVKDHWPGTGETAHVLAAPRWAHPDVESMGPVADPNWMED